MNICKYLSNISSLIDVAMDLQNFNFYKPSDIQISLEHADVTGISTGIGILNTFGEWSIITSVYFHNFIYVTLPPERYNMEIEL